MVPRRPSGVVKRRGQRNARSCEILYMLVVSWSVQLEVERVHCCRGSVSCVQAILAARAFQARTNIVRGRSFLSRVRRSRPGESNGPRVLRVPSPQVPSALPRPSPAPFAPPAAPSALTLPSRIRPLLRRARALAAKGKNRGTTGRNSSRSTALNARASARAADYERFSCDRSRCQYIL